MTWLVIDDRTGVILKKCATREGAARSVTRRFNAAANAGLLNEGEGFTYVEEEYYYRQFPWKKLGISYEAWYEGQTTMMRIVTSESGV